MFFVILPGNSRFPSVPSDVIQWQGHFSTTGKYIRSKTHSNAHQTVFTKDSDTKQIVSDTLKKLNTLSEKTCAELTATIKRRKLTERDHFIITRLDRAKEQAKQPAVAGIKKHKTEGSGKTDDDYNE